MKIGQLSKLSGFSTDTIRWYEKIGLIHLDKKDRYPNNYRNYGNEVLEQLLQIKQIKSFGFTLNEIKEMQLLQKHELLNCQSTKPILEHRLTDIENKIAELQIVRQKLILLRDRCTGNCLEEMKS